MQKVKKVESSSNGEKVDSDEEEDIHDSYSYAPVEVDELKSLEPIEEISRHSSPN